MYNAYSNIKYLKNFYYIFYFKECNMKKYTKYILFCTKFIFIIVMYKKHRKYTEKFCININYVIIL